MKTVLLFLAILGYLALANATPLMSTNCTLGQQNSCLHSGVCNHVTGVCNCTNSLYYQGAQCQTLKDYCAGNCCANGGTCVNGPGYYTCNCTGTRFLGDWCRYTDFQAHTCLCANDSVRLNQVESYALFAAGPLVIDDLFHSEITGDVASHTSITSAEVTFPISNGVQVTHLAPVAGPHFPRNITGNIDVSQDSQVVYNVLVAATNAIDDFQALSCDVDLDAHGPLLDLGYVHKKLGPAVYCWSVTENPSLSRGLILNGGAVSGSRGGFIVFQIDGSLSVGPAGGVTVENCTSACHVYWVMDGDFTMAAGANFTGTVIAGGSITLGGNNKVTGRLISLDDSGSLTIHGKSNFVTNKCPDTLSCVNPDPCLNGVLEPIFLHYAFNSLPCRTPNNGFCHARNSTAHTCECFGTGYQGTNCQTVVDTCGTSSDPCLHGGFCNVTNNVLTCNCTGTGYHGTHCQTLTPNCPNVNPCKNGGTCVSAFPDFYCNCTGTHYQGATCRTDVNECLQADACLHGGICNNQIGTYFCDCTDTGYLGSRCQTLIDSCPDTNPCKHGGTCVNLAKSFACNCTGTGYTGLTCNTLINLCPTTGVDRCAPYGVCTPAAHTTVCTCDSIHYGAFCNRTELIAVNVIDLIAEQGLDDITQPYTVLPGLGEDAFHLDITSTQLGLDRLRTLNVFSYDVAVPEFAVGNDHGDPVSSVTTTLNFYLDAHGHRTADNALSSTYRTVGLDVTLPVGRVSAKVVLNDFVGQPIVAFHLLNPLIAPSPLFGSDTP